MEHDRGSKYLVIYRICSLFQNQYRTYHLITKRSKVYSLRVDYDD